MVRKIFAVVFLSAVVLLGSLSFWLFVRQPSADVVEDSLCRVNPGLEKMYVRRCVKRGDIIYLKEENSGEPDDTGTTTFYNKKGRKICETCGLCGEVDSCFNLIDSCSWDEWIKICSSGGW